MIEGKDIEKLAALARLKLSSDDAKELGRDLDSILGYVSEIQSLTSENPEKKAGELRNVLREDGEPHPSGAYTEALLTEAPSRDGACLKVKKILS